MRLHAGYRPRRSCHLERSEAQSKDLRSHFVMVRRRFCRPKVRMNESSFFAVYPAFAGVADFLA